MESIIGEIKIKQIELDEEEVRDWMENLKYFSDFVEERLKKMPSNLNPNIKRVYLMALMSAFLLREQIKSRKISLEVLNLCFKTLGAIKELEEEFGIMEDDEDDEDEEDWV